MTITETTTPKIILLTVLRAQQDGSLWERRCPAADHYTAIWPDGHMCLHASPACSGMIAPAKVDRKIVATLWAHDVATGAGHGENGVEWCMTCACDEVVVTP